MRKTSCDSPGQWDTDESFGLRVARVAHCFPSAARLGRYYSSEELIPSSAQGKLHELQEALEPPCLTFDLQEMLKKDRMAALTC